MHSISGSSGINVSSVATINEPVCIPSEPFTFTEREPINIKITDFGVGLMIILFGLLLANWVDKHWLWIVQPDGYRAPEVILDMSWSTPIDIWSFGCIVFPYLNYHLT
jgi:serine/threonine protein kinase